MRGKGKEKRERYIKEMSAIEGKTFFLKLKPANIFSKMIKNVVVIYTEPENTENVFNMLTKKLTRRDGLVVALVKYHFK